ncbi:unnamed protein product [Ostreobium quekettii]|uniref:Uncharacterized protein n=1 Tax=Ostreobium quekettii TaxID=121088 RepID=A0A8S1J354_9CHLO|nr:unnamed protein product [Ostreobium quekettii]
MYNQAATTSVLVLELHLAASLSSMGNCGPGWMAVGSLVLSWRCKIDKLRQLAAQGNDGGVGVCLEGDWCEGVASQAFLGVVGDWGGDSDFNPAVKSKARFKDRFMQTSARLLLVQATFQA